MKSKRYKRVCILTGAAWALCLALASCAPSAPGASTKPDEGASNESSAASWSMSADCGTCHTKESATIDDPACLASTHAAQGETCTTCHKDEAGLQAVHKDTSDMKLPKKLKHTEVTEDTCTGCHKQEDLVAATAGLTVLTDSNGTVVNPHESMTLTEGHENIACSSCHSMHTNTSAVEAATDLCVSCHHAGVYECNTCH